jgi:uncharacterized integral membrane protein
MKSVIKGLILLPIAVVFLCFAVANRQSVTVFFDPFVSNDQDYAVAVPLFLVFILALMAGVLIGGVASWLNQSKHRRAARAAKAEAERLKAAANLPPVRF